MNKSQASEMNVKDLRPSKFDVLFKKYADLEGIDWKILKVICQNESSMGTNPRVLKGLMNPFDIVGSTSTDGKSWGIMQIILSTGRDFDKNVNEVKLNNPDYSVAMSAKLVKVLSKRYNGKFRDIMMAYNHGMGNQDRFIQKEKDRTLKDSEFLAGRDYLAKSEKNFKLIFGVV